jgi:hypothetical protein
MYHLVLIINKYRGEVWNISSRPQTRKYIPPGVDYNQLQSRSLKHFHMQKPLSYQLRTIFMTSLVTDQSVTNLVTDQSVTNLVTDQSVTSLVTDQSVTSLVIDQPVTSLVT